jgi:hypothetical protein
VTSQEIFALASRYGVSTTLLEPRCDIGAQIKALMDEDHPKEAVFLARGNWSEDWSLPNWVFVEHRAEGTLITTSATMACFYRTMERVTDDDLAVMLGYPETKSQVLAMGSGVVVQALDKDGCVVLEFAASHPGLNSALAVASLQTPPGGRVNVTTPEYALARRISGMN